MCKFVLGGNSNAEKYKGCSRYTEGVRVRFKGQVWRLSQDSDSGVDVEAQGYSSWGRGGVTSGCQSCIR